MIILNNMYTGRYITSQGKLGHEIINLFKADDSKFYIWLNSMGICTRKDVNNSTVLMLRSVNSNLYKILGKGVNCQLCPGVDISRDKGNNNPAFKDERYKKQKALKVKYNGKCPMDDIFDEQDMFATFVADDVREPVGDVYLTNDRQLADPANGVYYVGFKISEAMRAYVNDSSREKEFEDIIKKIKWKAITDKVAAQNVQNIAKPTFNFFKLIRKEKDELSFSNALAYFIQEVGIAHFLENCLSITQSSFLSDNYQILREKNNIDISFFGDNYVVIIENKIDANITADGRVTIDAQINKAIELYCKDASKSEKDQFEITLKNIVTKQSCNEVQTSQLSKYYLYAVAYLLNKGVSTNEVENRIKCFLLIPKYADKRFKSISNFLFNSKYRIITYEKIYNYFSTQTISANQYLPDFISALNPLKNEFDNEIEEELKYRFYKTIGII